MVSLDSSRVSITLSMWSIMSSYSSIVSSSFPSENFCTFFAISWTNLLSGFAILLCLLISLLSMAMFLAADMLSSNTLSSRSSRLAIIFLDVCIRSSTSSSIIVCSSMLVGPLSGLTPSYAPSPSCFAVLTRSVSGFRSPWWTVIRKSLPTNIESWLFLRMPPFWASGGKCSMTKK